MVETASRSFVDALCKVRITCGDPASPEFRIPKTRALLRIAASFLLPKTARLRRHFWAIAALLMLCVKSGLPAVILPHPNSEYPKPAHSFGLRRLSCSPKLLACGGTFGQQKTRATFVGGFCVFFVNPAGFEPATVCLEGRCSIQLSYESNLMRRSCREDRTRTCDPLVPNQMRYHLRHFPIKLFKELLILRKDWDSNPGDGFPTTA